jgi:predicted nuclease of predicted toxin-antitoxin system
VNFLLDMGLARSSASWLRAQGFDAVHLREQNLQRLTDAEIIEKALAENRVILTHDLDFTRIVALSGSRTPSVMTFRLSDMRSDQVNLRLADVLARFGEILEAGALISVTDQSIRVRRLPVTN